jgi:serine/threonine-protein kinase HipA
MADENLVFVGVHLDASGRAMPAGAITFADDGSGRAWFEYNPAYRTLVRGGGAFALDPANLPVLDRVFELPGADHPGVFGDGAPDHWGLLVLRRLLGVAAVSPLERLVRSGEDRIGALAFRHRTIRPERPVPPTPAILEKYGRFIRSMCDGSAPLLEGDGSDQDMRAAALAGSSAGGARPKCTFRDADGVFWLAKFSRPDDPVSVPAIEHAGMALAVRAGIRTARTVLHRPGGGTPVVLVERFDRTADGRRIPFISMQSVLRRASMCDGGYPEMAETLRKLSCRPEADAREMFVRMVYNAVCGNTDDHLKNHAMVLTTDGWRLSPAYDITPQAMPDAMQSIVVGDHGAAPTIDNLLSGHALFRLSLADARAALSAVLGVAAGWKDAFRAEGVTDGDIDTLASGDGFAKVLYDGGGPPSM